MKEGNYICPRAHHEPPHSLQWLVFPEIDKWIARVKARANGKRWKDGGLDQDDRAAVNFLKLIDLLWDVFL
jgi:hypothetical protein